MRIVLQYIMIAAVALSVSACYKKDFESGPSDYGSRDHKGNQIQGSRAYGLQIKGGTNHDNTTLNYSQELSDVVSGMQGIASSIVMVTDKNAYVAILVDWSATGSMGNGKIRETDNTGNTRGMYHTPSGSQYADPNKLATGSNNYITNYDHELLSSDLKQTIAEKIRRLRPEVLEVHISANRDFINRMNIYSIESRKGKSLHGYVGEFNELAVHYFGIKP